MKKYFKYLLLSVVVISSSSCKKYLDINTNPNSLTSATPALVLPQAIVGAASISNTFNISLADFSGARANAGGFGGFGAVVTYDFGTDTYAGLWTSTYDNANDFQYIIDETSSDPSLIYSTSIARIMKSFAFERLVNQFNDVPYSDALKGTESLQPKYDNAIDIYKACISELDKAITDITAGEASAATTTVPSTADPMFKGNMDLWKRFANTIKLRMLIKMAGVDSQQSYTSPLFTAMNASNVGFLETDALVNPGYIKTERPNPTWGSIGFTGADANTTTSRIPTKWIYSFYNGGKISDPGRARLIYRGFPSAIINQLGDESTGVPAASSAGSAWTTATKENQDALGVAKGPTQSQPILLASEAYFLRAEAYLRGYLTGNAEEAFDSGILWSFNYLSKPATAEEPGSDAIVAGVTDLVVAYETANSTNYLVNYAETTNFNERLEAIITQKYIALNMVSNDEAFNEFRRTTYPKIVNGSSSPTETFASRQSISTRPDRLPSRVLYPQQEYNLNPNNAPAGINKFTSRIFWDLD